MRVFLRRTSVLMIQIQKWWIVEVFKSLLLLSSLLLISWRGFVLLSYHRQKRGWWCAPCGGDADPFQTRQEEEGDNAGQGWSSGWTRTWDPHPGSPDSRWPGTNGHDQSAKWEFCTSPVGCVSSSFVDVFILTGGSTASRPRPIRFVPRRRRPKGHHQNIQVQCVQSSSFHPTPSSPPAAECKRICFCASCWNQRRDVVLFSVSRALLDISIWHTQTSLHTLNCMLWHIRLLLLVVYKHLSSNSFQTQIVLLG